VKVVTRRLASWFIGFAGYGVIVSDVAAKFDKLTSGLAGSSMIYLYFLVSGWPI